MLTEQTRIRSLPNLNRNLNAMKDLECSNSSNKIEKEQKLAKKTKNKKLETKVRSQKAFKEGL
jgi:hypothetical protein